MLKFFFRAFLVLLAVAMIPVVIGYFLPRDYSITAEIEIEAPIEKVFVKINTLKEWQAWSPWNSNAIDDLTVKYSGPKSGEKSAQSWQEPRGSGKLWITDVTEPELIKYKMEFEGFPIMDSQFELSESDSKTTVVWKSNGELPPGPFYGWTSIIFERGLTSEYRKGLGKLKEVCETDK